MTPTVALTSTANRSALARRVYGITHTAQHDGQTIYSEFLDYADRDRVGNPNTIVRSGHLPTANTSGYLYDTLHRVSGAVYSADSTTEDINLDVLGNRMTYTGRIGPKITYTHNLVNQYTALNPQITAPEYDANGNLTRNDRGFRFEYDYENRLKLIKAPNGVELTEYWYDALGRRNCEYRTDAVVPAAATVFYYDGRNIAAEYDFAFENLLRYYIHGTTYIDERAVVHESSENKDYAFALNDVYSVVAMVNNQAQAVGAYTYDVYGLMRSSDPTDRDPRYAFQGRPLAVYQTAQGATLPIYDFRARVYDPILGRFQQCDPLVLVDPLPEAMYRQSLFATPQNANLTRLVEFMRRTGTTDLYQFLMSNPNGNWDPNGTFSYGEGVVTSAIAAGLLGTMIQNNSLLGTIANSDLGAGGISLLYAAAFLSNASAAFGPGASMAGSAVFETVKVLLTKDKISISDAGNILANAAMGFVTGKMMWARGLTGAFTNELEQKVAAAELKAVFKQVWTWVEDDFWKYLGIE